MKAGILTQRELDRLLIDYQPFSQHQRFGEFLRLNLSVSAKVIDFLLNPLSSLDDGFNDKRLGERLVELGLIESSNLKKALEHQKYSGKRLGEILEDLGVLSSESANFFSDVRISDGGKIDFRN